MPSARIAHSILLATLALFAGYPVFAETGAQAGQVVGHAATWSDHEATVELQLTDGRSVVLALVDGTLHVGDDEVGMLASGGPLSTAWRELVEAASGLTSDEVLRRIRALVVSDLTPEDQTALRELKQAVGELSPVQTVAVPGTAPVIAQQEPSEVPAPAPTPPIAPVDISIDLQQVLEGERVYTSDFVVPSGEVVEGTITMLGGDLTVRGRVRGDVVALDGDVILLTGGVVEGNVHLLRGELIREGGSVGGRVALLGSTDTELPESESASFTVDYLEPSSPSVVGEIATGVMSLLGAFVGLAFMGIGLMFFAPRQLEAVADTVWHSFGRSFLAGLFAQPLLIPFLALLVIGLTITIVGILLVPFAIVAFFVAVFLAATCGYIAVARTVGEIYLRRRMAKGLRVSGWLTYRYLFYGLLGLLLIWLPAVFFGRVPLAGTIMTVSAAVLTWILATAGFGATLVSRGGIRGTVVRRIDRALSDDRFWEPSALPTLPRQGGGSH